MKRKRTTFKRKDLGQPQGDQNGVVSEEEVDHLQEEGLGQPQGELNEEVS